MVRVSDCRMSGTASGTIVLHAAPEAAVGYREHVMQADAGCDFDFLRKGG
jgi:dihydroxy-acid dehydratase